MLQRSVRTFSNGIQQSVLDVLRHASRITADIEIRATLQPLEHLLGVLLNAVLDVNLVVLVARKRRMQMRQNAVLHHALKLVLVEEVHLFALLSEEQPVLALRSIGLTLLKKRAERSNSRPWPDHDHRSVRIFRETEVVIRMQKDRHRLAFTGTVANMSTRHALSVATVRVITNHSNRRVNAIRMNLLARRDRVHTRCQALQDIEQLLRIGDNTRKIGR